MDRNRISRRDFLKTAGFGTASILLGSGLTGCASKQLKNKSYSKEKPNLVFIFADQWRAQAMGYAGDSNAITPNLDRFAKQSINFTNAVSDCPVCSPYRASLITGRYPLTHGVFLNDVLLNKDAISIAQAYKNAGYQTAYIGKWHLDGYGREKYIPRERHQGFDFWRGFGCTHDYNNSLYYADDDDTKLKWNGYDAIAQTQAAQQYIREHACGEPFVLFLSWGPPHNPYETAPEKYKKLFANKNLKLRLNVPKNLEQKAREDLAGYYAHIAALDGCFGDIIQTLSETGLEDNTIVVFTSDHGDMLYSQGMQRKQCPWDESIRVPFLIRYPAELGKKGKTIDMPIDTPDVMPTLLGLSGVDIPDTVEGQNFADVIRGTKKPSKNAALIASYVVFGEWTKDKGGREFRGVRTRRYTYVRDLNGPWLLYDNKHDPYQLTNLCNKPEYVKLQKEMDDILAQKLKANNDEFLPGILYLRKWGYVK